MATQFAVLALLLFTATSPSQAAAAPYVASKQVKATGTRSCSAWLVTSKESVRGAPVVLAMSGTGEYTMRRSWIHDPAAPFVLEAGAAWLVFDKPGVVADEKAPRGFRIEDAVYNGYTPADLETCAANALAWARSLPQVGGTAPIVVRGHSEGALVASHLLKRLFEKKDVTARLIKALLLSGTPAGAMREISARQSEASGKTVEVEKALATGDDAYMRKLAGMGAAAVKALNALPPLTETFAALASHRPMTRITLFHGLNDRQTPVEMVHALVMQNQDRNDSAKHALELTARFYSAGHNLNAGAMHDLTLWTLDALRSDGYLDGAEREAVGPIAVEVPEKTVASVVGRYRVDESMVLDIVREGSRLFAQATGQRRFPIFFSSEDRLFSRVAPIDFEIERGEKGVEAVVLIQGGRTRCPRIE